jgi:hypothetical protein
VIDQCDENDDDANDDAFDHEDADDDQQPPQHQPQVEIHPSQHQTSVMKTMSSSDLLQNKIFPNHIKPRNNNNAATSYSPRPSTTSTTLTEKWSAYALYNTKPA